jgi:hypothetical protein
MPLQQRPPMNYLSRLICDPSLWMAATGQLTTCVSVPPPQPTSRESLQAMRPPFQATIAGEFRPPCKKGIGESSQQQDQGFTTLQCALKFYCPRGICTEVLQGTEALQRMH